MFWQSTKRMTLELGDRFKRTTAMKDNILINN